MSAILSSAYFLQYSNSTSFFLLKNVLCLYVSLMYTATTSTQSNCSYLSLFFMKKIAWHKQTNNKYQHFSDVQNKQLCGQLFLFSFFLLVCNSIWNVNVCLCISSRVFLNMFVYYVLKAISNIAFSKNCVTENTILFFFLVCAHDALTLYWALYSHFFFFGYKTQSLNICWFDVQWCL